MLATGVMAVRLYWHSPVVSFAVPDVYLRQKTTHSKVSIEDDHQGMEVGMIPKQ